MPRVGVPMPVPPLWVFRILDRIEPGQARQQASPSRKPLLRVGCDVGRATIVRMASLDLRSLRETRASGPCCTDRRPPVLMMALLVLFPTRHSVASRLAEKEQVALRRSTVEAKQGRDGESQRTFRRRQGRVRPEIAAECFPFFFRPRYLPRVVWRNRR